MKINSPSEVEQRNLNRLARNPSRLARAGKIIGSTLLSGVVGFGIAKGVEFAIPVHDAEFFETVSVLTGAALGGFISSEATA